MDKITNRFTSIEQVTGEYLRSAKSSRADNSSQASFEEILRKKQNQRSSELKFSKHASMRLEAVSYTHLIFDCSLGVQLENLIKDLRSLSL